MAETSRSRVTITLGGSGQVVKRAGAGADGGFYDSQPAVGNKRSVRDRLGSNVDGIKLNNKRKRGDSKKLSMNGASVDDVRLGKDDLRFKLMRKHVRQVQSDDQQNGGVDLRETLSRAVRPSPTNLSMRQQRMPEPTDYRHLVPQQKDATILGQIPSTRSADVLPQMGSWRNAYSPWTLDQLRKRSPDRVLHTYRNLSPQRNEDEITKKALVRTYDDARTVSYLSRDVLEPGRPLGTTSYMARPTVAGIAAASSITVKPVVPTTAPPSLPSGSMHKSSYTGDEHLSVDGLLHSLGLEKYAINFKAEEVDMTALRQMGDIDLKDLGIPMGPRKKILLALLPHSKRQL